MAIRLTLMSDKTVSILIIDQDPQDITQRLKHLSPNFVFHHASSGKFALESFATRRVDCILLELDLNDMSGFEILHHIVPSPANPEVAVIVWTRLTHPSLLLIAKHNGAQAALVKRGTTAAMLHDAMMRTISVVHAMRLPLPIDQCLETRPS